jgi:hypothetical protein
MNYSFHPDAEDELEEAENHYDGIDETLGDRFRAEFEMSIRANTFISTCRGNRYRKNFGVAD